MSFTCWNFASRHISQCFKICQVEECDISFSWKHWVPSTKNWLVWYLKSLSSCVCYGCQSHWIQFSGIGRPPGQMDPKAFLLQKFNASARERVCPLQGPSLIFLVGPRCWLKWLQTVNVFEEFGLESWFQDHWMPQLWNYIRFCMTSF